MNFAPELPDDIDQAELTPREKSSLRTAWYSSGAAFAAECTALTQGEDARGRRSQQLKSMLQAALVADSTTYQRDRRRVALLVAGLAPEPAVTIVSCENRDTRMWLAAKLREILAPQLRNDPDLRSAISVDPADHTPTRVGIVHPDHPLARGDFAQVRYPTDLDAITSMEA
ncbi:hypothetical protein [Corynebacterium epidermidicanis]|uniref:Uncharacterized protein n=1 Tax=Corynebacterium epidermidicanis TaxID=1050174 RepID=A0A0G3GQS9_9CORY|nr:hypothetical protein [Corynebacterium epidermidicanis]AKK03494.1 hypothetical protein CEPID_08220 [Corynebacterium epidermidicanis]